MEHLSRKTLQEWMTSSGYVLVQVISIYIEKKNPIRTNLHFLRLKFGGKNITDSQLKNCVERFSHHRWFKKFKVNINPARRPLFSSFTLFQMQEKPVCNNDNSVSAAGDGVLWSWVDNWSDQKHQRQLTKRRVDRLRLQRDPQGETCCETNSNKYNVLACVINNKEYQWTQCRALRNTVPSYLFCEDFFSEIYDIQGSLYKQKICCPIIICIFNFSHISKLHCKPVHYVWKSSDC